MSQLTPPEFIKYIEEVLQFGVQKGYAPNGWQDGVKFNPRDNYASMCRHAAESYCGVQHDHESKLHPLQHLATRALMQVWYIKNKIETDKLKKNFE